MMPTFVTRLLAAAVLFVAAPAAAADGRGQLGDWTITADRGDDGAPYCYAGADRGPGDRLTFLRSDVGLAVILTRRDWRLGGDEVEVDVAVAHGWHDRRRAALGPRTLMLTWPRPAAVRAALAGGDVLRVTGHATGRGVRWSLAGGAAALDAIERCWRTRRAASQPGRAPDADPFHADGAAAASPEPAVDRGELAGQFETWLDLAAASYRATVTPVAAAPARFALATVLGDGAIRLLDGATDAAVLARGTAALRAECEATAATADHGRHELGGIVVQRTGLACGHGRFGRLLEGLILSWPEQPGGLLIVVPDPGGDGLGAEFTAALVADLAARGGLGFEPARRERPS